MFGVSHSTFISKNSRYNTRVFFSNYDEIFDKNGTNYEQLLYQWPICNGAGDQIDFPRPILIDCCLKGQMLFRPSQYVTNITITLINKGITPKGQT